MSQIINHLLDIDEAPPMCQALWNLGKRGIKSNPGAPVAQCLVEWLHRQRGAGEAL